VRLALALLLTTCGASTAPFDPEVLSGTVVRASHTDIEVASDFADSATTRVRGIDGATLGLRQGDRIRVRRRDASVGKADPLDWDCTAAGACRLE
jgi:hypothetical protein